MTGRRPPPVEPHTFTVAAMDGWHWQNEAHLNKHNLFFGNIIIWAWASALSGHGGAVKWSSNREQPVRQKFCLLFPPGAFLEPPSSHPGHISPSGMFDGRTCINVGRTTHMGSPIVAPWPGLVEIQNRERVSR